MNIPFLDLKAQYRSIKSDVDPAIQNILDNTAFVLGKSVTEFETAFAKAHSVKHCIGVSSGTDGNHLALWALGIGPCDEVIVPANTFIATAWGATLCGATPVFVDCHPESYNTDPAKIVAAITPKTKAIVAVHLYGQSADMDALNEQLTISNYQLKEQGVFVHKTTGQAIYLVEDSAQAHIAEYKGQRVGGLGAVASFSFYPGKNLGAYGEAGAVTTNDDEVAKKVTLYRAHGASEKYIHETYGHNYRMEGIQGAVLGVKLKYLNEWTEKRRAVAARYRELLSGVEEIIVPKEMEYAKHVYHLFVIQVKPFGSAQGDSVSASASARRDALMKFLGDNGIATGLHYPVPLHVQPCFKHLGYKKGDFPVAEQLSACGLSLPMFPEMTEEQIGYVCGKIREFFRK